jgi:hypothetical protein
VVRSPEAATGKRLARKTSRQSSCGTICSQRGSLLRVPTFHVLCTSPVCRSHALTTRLREEEMRVLLSGLTASAVMGSESCTGGRRSARGSWVPNTHVCD